MRALWVLAVLLLAGCASSTDDATGDAGPGPDLCATLAPPSAPGSVRTVPGPGPGMLTVLWQPASGEAAIANYTIYRDDEPIRLGNTLAFGDHGARSYRVAATDVCGRTGPTSEAVTGTALPGGDLLEATVAPLGSADSSEILSFPTYDAAMQETGDASWRIVAGTGNCCENYVITTHTGRIVDFGGTFLHYSDDEGETWKTVQTPIPYLTGEGALVTGPQGDIVAVGWSPYTGDQLWAHKYVAADDQWYYQTMPIHQPFYDRAWVSVIKGPFEIAGRTAPYIVQVESNYHGSRATVLLRSLDGLHYFEANDAALLLDGEATVSVPELGLDPDMDWMHPISQSPTLPLAPGYGLQQGSFWGTGCAWRVVVDDGSHACPSGAFADMSRHVPRLVDSAGNTHEVLVDRGSHVDYRVMIDGAWVDAPRYEFPTDWRVRSYDAKVHAGLDLAVVAMHMTVDDGNTGDYLVRYRNVTTAPVIDAVFQVGAADSGSDAGLGGDRRFDFMTVGLLPDGRAVLSFTDDDHHPPALAVQQ